MGRFHVAPPLVSVPRQKAWRGEDYENPSLRGVTTERGGGKQNYTLPETNIAHENPHVSW